MDGSDSDDSFFNDEASVPKRHGPIPKTLPQSRSALQATSPVRLGLDPTCVDLTDSPLPPTDRKRPPQIAQPSPAKQSSDCIVITDSDEEDSGRQQGARELHQGRQAGAAPRAAGGGVAGGAGISGAKRTGVSWLDDSPSPPRSHPYHSKPTGARTAGGVAGGGSRGGGGAAAATGGGSTGLPSWLADSPSPAHGEDNSPGLGAQMHSRGAVGTHGPGLQRKANLQQGAPEPAGSLDLSEDGSPAGGPKAAASRKRKTEAERQQDRDRKAGEREAERQRKAEEREEAKRHKQKEAQARKKEKDEAKKARDAAKEAAAGQKRVEKRQQQKENGKFQLQEITVFLSKEQMLNDDGGLIKKKLQDEKIAVDISFDSPSLSLGRRKYISWARRIWAPDGSQGSQAPDDASGQQDPVPYILLVLTGSEFVDLVIADGIRPLLREAAAARPGFTISLLIVGFAAHLETRQRHEIKQFGPAHPMPWRQAAYEVLAELHTRFEGVYHREAQDHEQAAEYIKDLTIAIAKQPYEDQNNFLGTFGGSGAKSKFRSEAKDESVFCQALCHIDGFGLHSAKGISSVYGNLAQLLEAYDDGSSNLQQKERLLVGLQGRGGTQKVGQSMSKKVFDMFASEDPNKVLG